LCARILATYGNRLHDQKSVQGVCSTILLWIRDENRPSLYSGPIFTEVAPRACPAKNHLVIGHMSWTAIYCKQHFHLMKFSLSLGLLTTSSSPHPVKKPPQPTRHPRRQFNPPAVLRNIAPREATAISIPWARFIDGDAADGAAASPPPTAAADKSPPKGDYPYGNTRSGQTSSCGKSLNFAWQVRPMVEGFPPGNRSKRSPHRQNFFLFSRIFFLPVLVRALAKVSVKIFRIFWPWGRS